MAYFKLTFKPNWICILKKEIEEISKILIKNKKIYILSDDIYEHIFYMMILTFLQSPR